MSLKSLIATGTKVWLDSIDPDFVVKNRAVGATGATSNPIIIADLIKSGRFDEELSEMLDEGQDVRSQHAGRGGVGRALPHDGAQERGQPRGIELIGRGHQARARQERGRPVASRGGHAGEVLEGRARPGREDRVAHEALALQKRLFRLWHRFRGDPHARPEDGPDQHEREGVDHRDHTV